MSRPWLDAPVGAGGEDRIATAADVLRWSVPAPGTQEILRDYVLLLGDRLGATMAALPDPGAEQLKAAMMALPDEAWMRLVTSPRCSYQLLWPSRHEAPAVAAFLEAASKVELARTAEPGSCDSSGQFPASEVPWSVLGDGWLGPDGQFVRGPAIENFAPIDFASPHALAIDLEGAVDVTTAPRPPLAHPEIEAVLSQLIDARERLAATGAGLLSFVVTFTKVLVLQRDAEAPTMFSTGSSAQYVGRSVFGNPHLAVVDNVLLADGLVHEAIHSLLYMSERLEPWVTAPELYGPEPRTRSGWSGHPLPLRSYLQACFVWYGLAQFWGLALGAGTFPADRARKRLEQSVRGFLDDQYLAQIEPYRDGIVPKVLEVIDRLRADVAEAAGGMR